MVGNEMLRVLAQRQFPIERVIALASERSKGMTVSYNGSSLKVEELREAAFKGIDVALFAASGDIALMYGPVAAESGAIPSAKLAFRNTPIHAHIAYNSHMWPRYPRFARSTGRSRRIFPA